MILKFAQFQLFEKKWLKHAIKLLGLLEFFEYEKMVLVSTNIKPVFAVSVSIVQ